MGEHEKAMAELLEKAHEWLDRVAMHSDSCAAGGFGALSVCTCGLCELIAAIADHLGYCRDQGREVPR